MKKEKILIASIVFTLILSIVTMVHAATGTISLVASSNQVERGNTFTVTVNGSADEDITGFQSGLVSYDTSKLALEGRTLGTGFTDMSGDTEMAFLNNGTAAKEMTICTLTFRVLDSAADGETTITLPNPAIALLSGTVSTEDLNLNVTIGSTSSDEDNNSVWDDNTVIVPEDNTVIEPENNTVIVPEDNTVIIPEDNNTITPVVIGGNDEENTNTNITYDPTTGTTTTSTYEESDDKEIPSTTSTTSNPITLPQTGVGIGLVVTIAGLAVFAVISYKKYKNVI